jgi:hypothetical protein
MTWSLQIRNGDLALNGPGGFQQVSGMQKLIQDLRDWMLEPQGTDPVHPDYGSNLDGGTNPDGSLIETHIGSVIDRERLLDIESELRRILASYQQQQLARLQFETVQFGGKNTFSQAEILASVNEVAVEQFGDVILARISVTAQDGSSITFVQPVSS